MTNGGGTHDPKNETKDPKDESKKPEEKVEEEAKQ